MPLIDIQLANINIVDRGRDLFEVNAYSNMQDQGVVFRVTGERQAVALRNAIRDNADYLQRVIDYTDRHRPKEGNEHQLRTLVAVLFSGPRLYSDDGELQDNAAHPFIDFLRDSPGEIQNKIVHRRTGLPEPMKPSVPTFTTEQIYAAWYALGLDFTHDWSKFSDQLGKV